jgi:hypothetical protein
MEVAFVANNFLWSFLLSLLIAYDEHHVLEEDEEGVVGVKKKTYTFFKRKQSVSKDEVVLSKID